MSAEQPPSWVEEAERLYLSRKLLSYRAVAANFNVAHQTVGQWAKQRRWQEKLRKVEDAAARELDERIQAEATEAIVDMFAAIEQNVISAGLRASLIVQRHMDHALAAQKAAHDKKAGFQPPGVHRSYFDAITAALELRPRRAAAGGLLEEIGQLLNPLADADDDDDDDALDDADDALDDADDLAIGEVERLAVHDEHAQ